MKRILWALASAAIGLALISADADAKRLGGARSLGTQRNVTAPPATPPAHAAQAAPAGAPNPAAPQPSGLSRWAPMLGGLALGGLLGAMFAGNGLGGLVLVLLLGVAAFFLVRLLSRSRPPAPSPLAYAGLGNETVAAPPPSQAAGIEPRGAALAPALPEGFDAAGFVRAAKLNFIKLQIANDNGNLDELREFTTSEMYEALSRDLRARAGARQTEVVALQADLLEVTSEQGRHWASVRFSGMVREAPGAAPTGFEEIWNLAKPVDGATGWLLAGIQQMH